MKSAFLRSTICVALLASGSHTTHTQSPFATTAHIAVQTIGIAGAVSLCTKGLNHYSQKTVLGLQTAWSGLILYQIYQTNVQLNQCAQLMYELEDAAVANQQTFNALVSQVTDHPTEAVMQQIEALHIHGENIRQQLHTVEKRYLTLQGQLSTLTAVSLTAVGTTGVTYTKIGWNKVGGPKIWASLMGLVHGTQTNAPAAPAA